MQLKNRQVEKSLSKNNTIWTKECLFLLGSCPSQVIMAARQGQTKIHPILRHDDETMTNQLILSFQNMQVATLQDLSFSLRLGTSESHDSMVFISLIQSLNKTSL